jgi:hypothetical protein
MHPRLHSINGSCDDSGGGSGRNPTSSPPSHHHRHHNIGLERPTQDKYDRFEAWLRENGAQFDLVSSINCVLISVLF